MNPEYYKPSEIKYNSAQIRWLIKNVLFHDSWPSDHTESGYTGGKGKTAGHHSNYETIRMIIGELSTRLRACGKAGLCLEYITLIDYEDQNYLSQRLAGYHGTTQREVEYLTNLALRYCCGRKRKHVTFNEFCTYTKSRDNRRHKKRGESTRRLTRHVFKV